MHLSNVTQGDEFSRLGQASKTVDFGFKPRRLCLDVTGKHQKLLPTLLLSSELSVSQSPQLIMNLAHVGGKGLTLCSQ